MIEALILFGSASRGDIGPRSDVDLLAVDGSEKVSIRSLNRIILSSYPKPKFLEMCRSGDLFALHIVKEGNPLYDPFQVHSMFCNEFKFKSSYATDMAYALRLGDAVVEAYSSGVNNYAVVKNLYFSLRRLLIAKHAKKEDLSFSLQWLLEMDNLYGADLISLLRGKYRTRVSKKMLHLFVEMLVRNKTLSSKSIIVKSEELLLDNRITAMRTGNSKPGNSSYSGHIHTKGVK